MAATTLLKLAGFTNELRYVDIARQALLQTWSNSTRIWALQATRSETPADSSSGSTRSTPGLPQ
jgi:hypothetical protein